MAKKTIKAVTLIRPWAAAVSHFGKDIENRSWKCPLPIGSYLAIHSGSKWDDEAAGFIEEVSDREQNLMCYKGLLQRSLDRNDRAIVAVAEFGGNVDYSSSAWWVEGMVGWKLDNVVPIDPSQEHHLYLPGRQGLWDLPPETLESVRRAFANNNKTRKT